MLLYVALVFVILSGVCSSDIGRTPSAPQRLKDLEAEVWQWQLKEDPVFATSMGDSSGASKLESFFNTANHSVYDDRRDTVQGFRDRLRRIDKTQLMTDKEKLDYVIFEHFLQTYLDGAEWNSYVVGNPLTPNGLRGYYEPDPSPTTEQQLRDYATRLSNLPQMIIQMAELMKSAALESKVSNSVSLNSVTGEIHKLLNTRIVPSELYNPYFTDALTNLNMSDADKHSLRCNAQNYVVVIKQALEVIKEVLVEAYLPAARSTSGVHGWPEGDGFYQQCLQYHTSTNMTAEEIYQLGLREVNRIETSMNETLQRLDFNGTVKEFFEVLLLNTTYKTEGELVQEVRNTIDRVKSKISGIFQYIPDIPVEVNAVTSDGPIASYQRPTPTPGGGFTPGILNINVNDHTQILTTSILPIVLHEVWPGHHMQVATSLATILPNYRVYYSAKTSRMPATFPLHTAFLEGWGTYAEYLGEVLNLYTDDYKLMGRYSLEMLRAARLVIDTGLHYKRWDREQAIAYLMDRTGSFSYERAKQEINRYITTPGQATAYKIGEIKIKDLRKKAIAELGENFEEDQFHTLLLANGPMPLSLLDTMVNEWIKEKKFFF